MATTYDNRLSGVDTTVAIKAPVRVATTANITLSGLQTIDTIALAEGDRVLVKNQTNAVENGIWVASTWDWYRAEDFNGARDVAFGTMVHVPDGDLEIGRIYFLSTPNPVTIGTSEITFDFANTIPDEGMKKDTFTGDGSTTTFALNADPGAQRNVLVFLDGLQQNDTDFSVAGNDIVFNEAPPNLAKIEVRSFQYAFGVRDAGSVIYAPGFPGSIDRPSDERLREFATVGDFGAVGDGVTDDTAAIQAALNSGQRVIYVPAGKYLITDQLVVSECTLRGEGYGLDTMRVTDADDLRGTVFICGFETATAESLFHLGAFGRIEDLMGYYPGQQATRPVSWVPVTTPWFCTSGDFALNDQDVRERESGMRNVMFLEFSHGIRLNKGGERGVFSHVFGNPLMVGLEADGCYDVVRFENFHFWPFGGNTGAWQANERAYTLNNTVHYRFGRVDGLLMTGIFSFGPSIGIEFYPCEDPAFLNYATTNFHICEAYLDNSNTSLKVSGTYVTNQMVGGHIAGSSMQHWANTDGAITTELENIVIESSIKQITLSSCRLQAGANERNGSYVRMNATHGKLLFTGSSVSRWDKANTGAAGFVQTGTNSKILLGDMQFFDPGNVEANLTGQTVFTGRVRIDGLEIAFAPTVTFATPGDTAISGVVAQTGRIKYDGECVHINIRFIANVTSTTGSGALQLTNIPHVFSDTSESVIAVGGPGITLTAGTYVVSAQAPSGQSYLSFVQERSATGATTLLNTNLNSGSQVRIIGTVTLRA